MAQNTRSSQPKRLLVGVIVGATVVILLGLFGGLWLINRQSPSVTQLTPVQESTRTPFRTPFSTATSSLVTPTASSSLLGKWERRYDSACRDLFAVVSGDSDVVEFTTSDAIYYLRVSGNRVNPYELIDASRIKLGQTVFDWRQDDDELHFSTSGLNAPDDCVLDRYAELQPSRESLAGQWRAIPPYWFPTLTFSGDAVAMSHSLNFEGLNTFIESQSGVYSLDGDQMVLFLSGYLNMERLGASSSSYGSTIEKVIEEVMRSCEADVDCSMSSIEPDGRVVSKDLTIYVIELTKNRLLISYSFVGLGEVVPMIRASSQP